MQFNTNLVNKTIAIIGGTGYTGTSITNKALSLGIKVLSISRSAEPHYHKNLKLQNNVQFIKADVINHVDSIQPYLEQADAVVHTIGTLLEGSSENSTYEKMNKQSAINVATLLNQVAEQQNRKIRMVYLGASGHPPFLPKYLETKEQAEQFIREQLHLEGKFLKPGFIYSNNEKPWSVGLKPFVNLYNTIASPMIGLTKQTRLHCITKNFDVDSAVHLDDVAYSAIVTAFDASISESVFFNKDMQQLRQKFSQNDYNVTEL